MAVQSTLANTTHHTVIKECLAQWDWKLSDVSFCKSHTSLLTKRAHQHLKHVEDSREIAQSKAVGLGIGLESWQDFVTKYILAL